MAIRFSAHAVRRMDEEQIVTPEVLEALQTGRMIEDYPTDTPYPSRLILGWVGGRPVHVVTAISAEDTIIVTVYRPNAERWDETFTIRRRR